MAQKWPPTIVIPKVLPLRETAALPPTTTAQQYTGARYCDNAPDRSAVTTDQDNDDDDYDFLYTLNCYMLMLVDDMRNLGSRLHTNLGKVNRAVVESILFPVDEVDGMLPSAAVAADVSRWHREGQQPFEGVYVLDKKLHLPSRKVLKKNISTCCSFSKQ